MFVIRENMRNNHRFTAIYIILILGMLFASMSSSTIANGQEGGHSIYLPLILNGKSINPVLVVGVSPIGDKFSPFFAGTESDSDVVSMTQLSVLTTDRRGGIVSNAIAGETRDYLGTPYLYKGPADTSVEYNSVLDQTTYSITLRQDLKFFGWRTCDG